MKKINKTYKYEIISQHGKHRSYHKTWQSAEDQRQKNLGWRCGLCGNNKGGWGKCKHGQQHLVADINYWSDRIVEVK